MKILHVPHAYHPVVGGAETWCRRATEVLRARGHDVEVLTTDVSAVHNYYGWGLPRAAGPRREVVNGVPVTRLVYAGWLYRLGGMLAKTGPRWFSMRVSNHVRRLMNARLFAQIRRAIARSGADIVMTTPHLITNVQAVLDARRTLDFHLVMAPMLHEEDTNWYAADMREALGLASAALTLTTHERERLVADYGVPDDRAFACLVGIDMKAPPVAPRVQRVTFLGRKVASKGVVDLIEAMTLVWRRYPDAELVLAGVRLPDTALIDDQIAALSDAVRRNVRNLDFISEAEKAELLATSQCFVLPSKTESFGIVILEAWAQETAAITWDLPVFRSIVSHEENGLLVDTARGAAGLAEAIERLLSDPEMASRLGKAGRTEAAARFSWDAVADVCATAYRTCLEDRRGGAA